MWNLSLPWVGVPLLVPSNAVQNSMNGGDNTVLGGLISAATLIALHYVVRSRLSRASAWKLDRGNGNGAPKVPAAPRTPDGGSSTRSPVAPPR